MIIKSLVYMLASINSTAGYDGIKPFVLKSVQGEIAQTSTSLVII